MATEFPEPSHETFDTRADRQLGMWTRVESAGRRPRFTREQIAAAGVLIADQEGFTAVSMRRIATQLDAGTMTLYHYVRTKDELLALMVDTVMGEVVLPANEPLPSDWRQAVTVIAHRSRNAIHRHPWMLDIVGAPSLGPNSVRHFDQSLTAVQALQASLIDRLDVITAIDEYVMGFCVNERANFTERTNDQHMIEYVEDLVATGDFPRLSELVEGTDLTRSWTTVHEHARDHDRFDRNLQRLLLGFAQSFATGD